MMSKINHLLFSLIPRQPYFIEAAKYIFKPWCVMNTCTCSQQGEVATGNHRAGECRLVKDKRPQVSRSSTTRGSFGKQPHSIWHVDWSNNYKHCRPKMFSHQCFNHSFIRWNKNHSAQGFISGRAERKMQDFKDSGWWISGHWTLNFVIMSAVGPTALYFCSKVILVTIHCCSKW